MAQAKSVVVYTVAWCPHCVAILSFLDAEGITYQNYDVDYNDVQWHEALALTGGQDLVPVINIEGNVKFGAFNSSFADWIRQHMK